MSHDFFGHDSIPFVSIRPPRWLGHDATLKIQNPKMTPGLGRQRHFSTLENRPNFRHRTIDFASSGPVEDHRPLMPVQVTQPDQTTSDTDLRKQMLEPIDRPISKLRVDSDDANDVAGMLTIPSSNPTEVVSHLLRLPDPGRHRSEALDNRDVVASDEFLHSIDFGDSGFDRESSDPKAVHTLPKELGSIDMELMRAVNSVTEKNRLAAAKGLDVVG